MNVAVIGTGYVGLVTGACLADVGHNVICVDRTEEKIRRLKEGVIPIYEPGLTEVVHRNTEAGRLTFTTSIPEAVDKSLFVFIAVGTPRAHDGSADLSAVWQVAVDIAEAMHGYKIVVGKSTVPVGTHARVESIVAMHTHLEFSYVSNPEFLKEGSAVEDFMKPDRIVVGTHDAEARELMRELYAPCMRRNDRMIFMDPASAELTKYAANAMLATRISFMNELSLLCERVGADIEQVRAGIGSDQRIGDAFLYAGLGYGGSCFPKDVWALLATAEAQDCPLEIVQATHIANMRQRVRFAGEVALHYKHGDILAVWGPAFKARTDDVRESPAITCIEQFLRAGLKVRAYDPAAIGRARVCLDGAVTSCDSASKAAWQAGGLVVLTDWQEFRHPDFKCIAALLKCRVIFDGRNLYGPAAVRAAGFAYHGIGRSS